MACIRARLPSACLSAPVSVSRAGLLEPLSPNFRSQRFAARLDCGRVQGPCVATRCEAVLARRWEIHVLKLQRVCLGHCCGRSRDLGARRAQLGEGGRRLGPRRELGEASGRCVRGPLLNETPPLIGLPDRNLSGTERCSRENSNFVVLFGKAPGLPLHLGRVAYDVEPRADSLDSLNEACIRQDRSSSEGSLFGQQQVQ